MIKYQNYNHFKLPITINPLKYGKLIIQIGKLFIIQINKTNITLITEYDNLNHIKLFREGVFVLEYRDHKTSENVFVRTINNNKYTFIDNKLIEKTIVRLIFLNTIKNIASLIPLLNNLVIVLKTKLRKLFTMTFDYIKNKFHWYDLILIPYFSCIFIGLFLIFLYIIYLLLFIIFPESNENIALVAFSSKNIIKLRKVNPKNIWNVFELKFGNKIFTGSLFQSKFNKFWKNIQSGFNKNNHLFILFKIKYNNGEFVTIGNLQRLNLTDKDWYINWIIDNMELKSEYYNENQIESLIFSYGFKDGEIPHKSILNVNYF